MRIAALADDAAITAENPQGLFLQQVRPHAHAHRIFHSIRRDSWGGRSRRPLIVRP